MPHFTYSSILVRWWIEVNVIGITLYGMYKYNIYQWLWDADITKLTFVILGLFLVFTLYLGGQTYHAARDNNQLSNRGVDFTWFVAESLTTLGLIGTVAGFMYMFGSAFESIDVSNVETTKQVIKNMAAGMSTALITTFMGLSCGLLLKLQLVNLDEATE